MPKFPETPEPVRPEPVDGIPFTDGHMLLPMERPPKSSAEFAAALLRRLERTLPPGSKPPAGAMSSPNDEPLIPFSGFNKGQRFKSLPELKRAAQEVALVEWNGDPTLPEWSRNGELPLVCHPGPIDLASLNYLSASGHARVERFSQQDQLLSRTERTAVGLMQEMSEWIERAKEVLAQLPTDGRKGMAIRAIENILNETPTAEVTGTSMRSVLELNASPFKEATLRRSDTVRTDLTWQAERILGYRPPADAASPTTSAQGRPTTARELALASILCGLFPEGIQMGPKGVTAAEVLGAETRTMRQAFMGLAFFVAGFFATGFFVLGFLALPLASASRAA